MRIFGYDIRRHKEVREADPHGAPLGLKYALGPYTDGDSMKLSAVYRSVDVISSAIAQLPIRLYSIDENGNRTAIWNNSTGKLLNRRPDARMNRYTFISVIVRSMLMHGNAYALIERDASRHLVNLRYVDASRVSVLHDGFNSNVRYLVNGVEKKPHEILHFMNVTTNGIEGISTIKAAAVTLGIASATDETARGFFTGGANMAGIIIPKSPMSKVQREELKKSWQESFSPVSGTPGGIAVAPVDLDFQTVSISMADAQLLQCREFNVIEIARFFGVNPVKLFDLTKSSYSTVEATQLSFLTDTLAPLLEKIEEELEYKLFADGIDVRFDSDVLLRNDKMSQASYLTSLVNNGVLSPNEARNVLGLAPVPGGDDVNIQVNMQKLNQESAEDGEGN